MNVKYAKENHKYSNEVYFTPKHNIFTNLPKVEWGELYIEPLIIGWVFQASSALLYPLYSAR